MKYLLTLGFLSMLMGSTLLADDLADERTLLKNQPVYESEHPGYMLLVFGVETRKSVWVVTDKNCVYIDRNSNGDITEANEKIEVAEIRKIDSPTSTFREFRHYSLGDIPKSETHPAYKKLSMQQFRIVTDNFPSTTPTDKAVKEKLARYPHLSGNISVKIDDFEQDAGPGFALSQEAAAIVHFDGPLSLASFDPGGNRLSFFEPGGNRSLEIEPENNVLPYKFRLGTPGAGVYSFAHTRSPTPPTLRAVLKDNKQNERDGTVELVCCGSFYCTTIKLPAGKQSNVVSVQVSVAPFSGRVIKPMEMDLKIIRPSKLDKK